MQPFVGCTYCLAGVRHVLGSHETLLRVLRFSSTNSQAAATAGQLLSRANNTHVTRVVERWVGLGRSWRPYLVERHENLQFNARNAQTAAAQQVPNFDAALMHQASKVTPSCGRGDDSV